MNLSEMSAEQLLNEYAAEVSSEDRRISSDPPSNQDALRAELLRRLQPVSLVPKCPRCGDIQLWMDFEKDKGLFVECLECDFIIHPRTPQEYAQFFASHPSVLSREGEGKDGKS